MKEYNSFSLTQYAATVAKAFGIEPPEHAEPALDWVCDCLADYCKDGYDRLFIHNPDAIAMWLYKKYPEIFEPVLKNTLLAVPFKTVMPSMTPVCFASMYTGAQPSVHGMEQPVKPRPVLKCDSLFDALIRAGKKVAVVSIGPASMSNLFKDRAIDIFNFESEGMRKEKVLEIILKDSYDVVILYTDMYDTYDHELGPEAKETMFALRYQVRIFDEIVSEIRKNWTDHNTLIAFSPDHGVHYCEPPHRPGDHGTDSPLDLNILHYFGAVAKSEK